jgi:hypothetical protein
MSSTACRYSLPIVEFKFAVLELYSFFEIMSAAFAYCTFSSLQISSRIALPAQAGIGREPHEPLKWFYNATM